MDLHRRPDDLTLVGWLAAPVSIGAALALAGGYWDDAWHTERGRDDFLIGPHVAIYGGVALAGAALAVWGARAARRVGLGAASRHAPVALALASAALTLASGPIDNAWHIAFGRDAVIWSAPHALGIVGMAGMAAAVLIEVSASDRRWAGFAQPIAGALLLTALVFFVVEYETDVPQFDPVWYLPVLATVSALALAIVRLLGDGPWASTAAAAVHLLLIAGVTLVMLALGFDAPQLPLLVMPAAVLDLLTRRGKSILLVAVSYVAALFAVYVPVLDAVGQGVYVDAADVLLGAPMAVAAVAVVLAAVRPAAPLGRARARALGAALTLAVLSLPSSTYAHDPGQGEGAGSATLNAKVDGSHVRLEARLLRPDCREFRIAAIVARRAGETLRAPMEGRRCRFSGALRLGERGRWFVYAEFERRGETVESWLPIKTDGGSRRFHEARRYAYVAEDRGTTASQALAAAGLYAVIVAFMAWTARLARRAGRVTRPSHRPRTATIGRPTSYTL